jgi:hypothetical protein
MSIYNMRQRVIHIDKAQLVSWYYTAESGTKKNVLVSPWLQKILKAGGSWTKTRVCSAPVQTGLGAHPTLNTLDIGRGVDHPHPSSVEVKEMVQLYLYSPSGPSWPVLGWTLLLPISNIPHGVIFQITVIVIRTTNRTYSKIFHDITSYVYSLHMRILKFI